MGKKHQRNNLFTLVAFSDGMLSILVMNILVRNKSNHFLFMERFFVHVGFQVTAWHLHISLCLSRKSDNVYTIKTDVSHAEC